MKSRTLFAVLTIAVGAQTAGCSADASSEQDLASDQSELFASSSKLWRAPRHFQTTKISVCVTNPAGYSKYVGWIRDILANTWSAAAKVKFEGFGACGSADVRLTFADGTPHVLALGTDATEVWLKPWTAEDESLEFLARYLVEKNAIHEFGHILGLAHEANHPDSTCDDTQGPNGDVYWEYDEDSVMNYCAPIRNYLSDLDKEGIAKLYGGAGTRSGKKYGLWNEGNGKFFYLFSDSHGDRMQFSGGLNTFIIERDAGSGSIAYGDKIGLKRGNKYISATANAMNNTGSLWSTTSTFRQWETEHTAEGNGGEHIDVRDPFRIYLPVGNKKFYLSTRKDQHSSRYLDEIVVVTNPDQGAEWRLMGDFNE
ncbi:MAG TPA: hypothetical protein VFQ61_33755 [Polyangiaceae bacterium]|nr:hypothetical protein [Polyangiaceae bacterium]